VGTRQDFFLKINTKYAPLFRALEHPRLVHIHVMLPGVDRLNRILQSLFRTVFAGETLNEFQTEITDFF
jgi:hypothetical protein